jgi:CheY-like chemotaxis protein
MMTEIDTTGTNSGRPAESGTILVIDNDPVAQELMLRILSREGFPAIAASSGEEGLILARKLRPAAIILDVVMPGALNGWDVLAALKGDPEFAEIPVIMATMVDERSKGFALGVTEYFVKPVERPRLAAILKKCQNKRAAGSVLIIEDDPANREILTRLVAKEGWKATEATNGRAALESVLENPPDLILLDLMMSVMDGFGFVRELHKIPAYRSIPIVAISAKELTDDDRHFLAGSVKRVMQKGAYSRDELMREIRKQTNPPGRVTPPPVPAARPSS